MESTRSIGYSFESALADIIDNSISACADNVWITSLPDEDPFVAVLDDGEGLTGSELQEAMRYGTNPGIERSVDDLGRFGLGMKMASLSQCRVLTVISKKDRCVSSCRWDLDRVIQTDQWTLQILDESEVEGLPQYDELTSLDHGTLIVWQKLDKLMWDRYGYQITLHRPPHYVDKMQDGFTSYDVCDKMGYQYMAASFDGAGWLPSTLSDPEAALEAEVNAMVEPMRKALEKDPDFFCGQIIFQKDGYNMGKRTPVAFGLRKQLELLKEYGYQVVTVDTLLAESPFADLGRDDPLFEKLNKLQQERAVVYSDNCLRLDAVMTCGELAMLLAPKEEALGRRWAAVRRSGKHENAYWGAMDWCAEQGLLPRGTKPDAPVTALPEGLFAPVSDFTRRSVYGAYKNQ